MSPFVELKDLNSSMTTEEMMKEIKELKQQCNSNQEKLQKIKSATNHVTPEEKEKVHWLVSTVSITLQMKLLQWHMLLGDSQGALSALDGQWIPPEIFYLFM